MRYRREFFGLLCNQHAGKQKKIPTLGSDAPMGRAGHPYEIAPLFVYLASDDASYVTGQVMHVNGGEYKG